MRQKIEEAKRSRTAPDRPAKLRRYEELKREEADLDKRLLNLKQNDPEELKRISNQATISKDAANRWTDNIFELRKFLLKKTGMSKNEVNKMIGIDSNFDYV